MFLLHYNFFDVKVVVSHIHTSNLSFNGENFCYVTHASTIRRIVCLLDFARKIMMCNSIYIGLKIFGFCLHV
jgi:hypothetical protein